MIAFRKNTSLKQLIGTNTIKRTKNFSHLHKQQPQVNVIRVKPVDHFAANKFSKQQHLHALKSLAIVTMSSSTY